MRNYRVRVWSILTRHSGSKNPFTTLFKVSEITKEAKRSSFKLVCENARPKSKPRIWVGLPTASYPRSSAQQCTESQTDKKATALLKLIYLEMFGYDMSWASFNVLEVMSSPKYPQKRVGYLGAVQSFRPDTEILMLATNMLKKVRLLHVFDKPLTDLSRILSPQISPLCPSR